MLQDHKIFVGRQSRQRRRNILTGFVSPLATRLVMTSRSHGTTIESKLTRVMDDFQKPSMDTKDRLDPDEPPDIRVTIPRDDDEGLHLMYDYPRAVVNDEPSPQPFPSTSQSLKIDATPDLILSPSRQRTVRFRSRVRITSGVHSVSTSSSCGSRSSSISVPLRGTHEPTASTSTAPINGWLTNLSSPRNASRDQRGKSIGPSSAYVDERTPFASANHPGSRRSYTEQSEDDIEDEDEDEIDRLRAAARKSEEEVMFGKWPWRLLNRHVRPSRTFVVSFTPQFLFRAVVLVEN